MIQTIEQLFQVLDYIIIVQIGHDVGGNFYIHIWAYSGDFIFRSRWTGKFVLM